MYQHNKVVYEELKDRLKTDTRVCVVQGTGTGKGVIARTLIEEYESVIVVAPTQAILKNYQMNLKVKSDNVQYFTYQAISMMLNPQLDNLAKGVTLLILDEFHRIGAKTWGRKVEYLAEKIENFNGKVVGLSATPVRYLDNERDMSVEFFNGNVVSGLNIVEAVVNGVLPTFKYVVSYYGYEKDLFKKMEERKDKLTDNIKALVANLENNYSIGKIIRQETKDLSDNQKWIVFFSSVEELESFKDTVPVWFDKKVTVYTLHSYSNYKENMNILNDFNNAEKGVNVLLSVNMLNEGVHIQGVDGVIMMRRTISPIVYLQQLGRALQVGGKEPIIFDFIGNYRRMGEYRDSVGVFNFIDEINNSFKNKNLKNFEKEKKILVSSYCEEITEILEHLSSLFEGSWTDGEISTLYKYYEKKGAFWISENILKHRSTVSVYKKAYSLGLRREDYREDMWSEEEINVLKNYYREKGVSWLHNNILVNRSKQAIKSKAQELNLSEKHFRWTEEEDSIIKLYYAEKGASWLFENYLNHRTAGSIAARAKEIGVTRTWWKQEELDTLLKYYSEKTVPELKSEFFPNKSQETILKKLKELGLVYTPSHYKYSVEEEELIRKFYPSEGTNMLWRLPSVTKESLARKARSMGVYYRNNDTYYWSDIEDEIIKKYYQVEGKDICKRLPNRTYEAIKSRAGFFNLTRDRKSWSLSEDEKNILLQYYPTEGIEVANRLPHRTKADVAYLVKRLNLTLSKTNSWTSEEDDIILKYYKTEGTKVADRLVNRTRCSIKTRAKTLGVTRPPYKLFTEEEDNIIRMYYPTEGTKVADRLVDRAKTVIKERARKLGVAYNFKKV